MGFNSYSALVNDIVNDGKEFQSFFRKVPNILSVSGFWYDQSMYPGNPSANYYAASPYEATVLNDSEASSIRHGGNVSPSSKFLKSIMVVPVTTSATRNIFCDYLLYYPFIDQTVTDPQLMDNNSGSLPRYTDGEGVQMIAVLQGAQTGGADFTVSYTNSEGVAGRTTPTIRTAGVSVNGAISSSAPVTAGCAGPFLPLQTGDTGVRSIESITYITPDTGLVALVLVKPLANIATIDATGPVEVDFFSERTHMPRIYDGAFLGFLTYAAGTIAATIGEAKFVW